MDAKLEEALVTIDDAKREALLAEASKIVMADHGLIPMHFEVSVWAMKKGLTYQGRADQNTLARSREAGGSDWSALAADRGRSSWRSSCS